MDIMVGLFSLKLASDAETRVARVMRNSAPMGFKFRRLLAIAVAAWLLIPLSSHTVQAQSNRPYSKEEVLKAIKTTASPNPKNRETLTKDLIQEVQQRGVGFKLTEEDERDLRKEGADSELIKIISKNYRRDPDADKSYNQGLTYEGSGDFKKAAEAYEGAIQHDPKFAEAYYALGSVLHYHLQKDKEAEGAFNNAIQLKPDYIEAYYSLASLYNDLGNLGQVRKAIDPLKTAVEIIKTAVESNPTAVSNPIYADVYYLLGAIYGNLGSYKEAIEPFEKAIEYRTNKLADVLYYLSISYSKSGSKDEALKKCDLLKELDPERANKLYEIIKSSDKL